MRRHMRAAEKTIDLVVDIGFELVIRWHRVGGDCWHRILSRTTHCANNGTTGPASSIVRDYRIIKGLETRCS